MIDLSLTQASRLARAPSARSPESQAWAHFVAPGIPPQELWQARALWDGAPEGREILRAVCSSDAQALLSLYAWMKRESIKAPVDEAWIAMVCEMGRGEEAHKAALGIELCASKFLLLPCVIKTHFY